jgi:hypothetical protein
MRRNAATDLPTLSAQLDNALPGLGPYRRTRTRCFPARNALKVPYPDPPYYARGASASGFKLHLSNIPPQFEFEEIVEWTRIRCAAASLDQPEIVAMPNLSPFGTRQAIVTYSANQDPTELKRAHDLTCRAQRVLDNSLIVMGYVCDAAFWYPPQQRDDLPDQPSPAFLPVEEVD